jgi:hypothetical protein
VEKQSDVYEYMLNGCSSALAVPLDLGARSKKEDEYASGLLQVLILTSQLYVTFLVAAV